MSDVTRSVSPVSSFSAMLETERTGHSMKGPRSGGEDAGHVGLDVGSRARTWGSSVWPHEPFTGYDWRLVPPL